MYLVPELLFDVYKLERNCHFKKWCVIALNPRILNFTMKMYKNIVLAGGGSMFEGITERLETELKVFHSNTIKVISKFDRKHATCLGEGLRSSLPDFQLKMISKAQYDEFGPSIVNKFCTNNVKMNHQVRKYPELSENLTKMLEFKID
jgi:hypothetical protein